MKNCRDKPDRLPVAATRRAGPQHGFPFARRFVSNSAIPPNAVTGAEMSYDQIVSIDIKPGQADAFEAAFAALKAKVGASETDTLAYRV